MNYALARRLRGYAETYKEYVRALRASPANNPKESANITHLEQVEKDLRAAAMLLGPEV